VAAGEATQVSHFPFYLYIELVTLSAMCCPSQELVTTSKEGSAAEAAAASSLMTGKTEMEVVEVSEQLFV
jgi:hypothetical protein